jgi:hypothetical protein
MTPWNTDINLMKEDYGGAQGTTIQTTFNNMSSPSFGQNTNNWGRRSLQMSLKVDW